MQIKKIIKFYILTGIYCFLLLSYIQLVSAIATTSGTLYQTIGQGTDSISVTNVHDTTGTFNATDSTVGIVHNWNGTSEYIEWTIQTNPSSASISLQSAGLIKVGGGPTLTDLQAAGQSGQPIGQTSVHISCSYPGSNYYEINSWDGDMYGSARQIWNISGCSYLSGKWRGKPKTTVGNLPYTAPGQYTGLMTATLSTT
jgi:hypothetical protein